MEVEIIFEKLFDFYKVGNINSLADALKSAPSTVSNWKQRNSISAIKKKCRELGIYNEIFGDKQEIDTNNGINEFASYGDTNIPDFIIDEISALFKRAKGNKNKLIESIDNFIAEQKNIYR